MNRLKNIYVFTLMFAMSILGANAQEIFTLKGKVRNAIGGQPIEKTSVNIVGVSDEYIETDKNGEFSLKLEDKNAVLRYWAAGYQEKIVEVKGRDDLQVFLFPVDYVTYDEEVSLYKGETTKRNAATALSLFTEDQLSPSATSFEQALQGNMPGLMVINKSGMPGDGASVYSRGVSSLNLINTPLIVVDGMILFNPGLESPIISGFTENTLQDIIPDDIEKITYLKGGATSLFGSLGGNDVLLITTKRSEKLNTQINFSTYGGLSFAPDKLPMLDNTQFVDYATSLAQSYLPTSEVMNQYPFLMDNPDYLHYNSYNNNTDWQDEVFKPGVLQNYFMSVKGGDAVAKYYLSVGYQNKEGIVDQTSLQKYSTRFNADIALSEKFHVSSSIGFGYRMYGLAEMGMQNETNPIYSALGKSPMLHPVQKDVLGNELGTWDPVREFNVTNPTALLADQDIYVNSFNFKGNLAAKYKVSNRLQLNAMFGYNKNLGRQNTFIPGADSKAIMPLANTEAKNTIRHLVASLNTMYADAGFKYNKTLDDAHHLGLMGGIRFLSNSSEYDFGTGMNTVGGDQFVTLGAASATNPRFVGGENSAWNLLTEYVQLTYNYKNQYFLGFNGSLDASSTYGDNISKFSFFPGVNAAWIVFNNEKSLDLLKLRCDYAITGNGFVPQNAASYHYVTQLYRDLSGIVRGNVPNENLKWEENAKFNAGFDLVTKQERLRVSLDYFKHKLSDVILTVPVSPVYGFSEVVQNAAAMKNSGFDVGVNLRLLDRPLKWTVSANVGKYTNKVTDLGDFDRIVTNVPGGQLVTEAGQSAYRFYGYQTNGILTSNEAAQQAGLSTPAGTLFAAGDVRFVDQNSDNMIGEADKVAIGDPNPDFYGGFGTNIRYKRIELSADFNFSYGNDVFNYLRREFESMSDFNNQTLATLNRWRFDGHNATMPRAVYGDPIGNSRFSDRWIEDGSYLKMREIKLSYHLPKNKLIRSGQVYVAGHNLLTITDYLGYDPEFSYSNNVSYMGIDYGQTPMPKSVIIGVKLGL